jgi:hypothetical protein
MTISELRILPPLAIGRLGASEHPLENYDLELPEDEPIGFRRIVPAETLRVDRATGEITESYKPEPPIQFRDGGAVRPVAPFLEVFARTSPTELQPLDLELLTAHGIAPEQIAKHVNWRVQVGNLKLFRRTGKSKDRIEADSGAFSDHQPHELLGKCKNFVGTKTLPLGSVQFIKPTADFPEIRLRFTPAKGLVYGASRKRKTVNSAGKVIEEDDPIIGDAQLLYNPKGDWVGFSEAKTPAPLLTVPGAIFAGYSDPDPKKGWTSWGYLDDECDGIVTVTLALGGTTLSAYARIGAGPPTFAPDAIPIRTVADELEQVLLGAKVDPKTVTLADAEEIVRRAIETVRLMNTAALNGNRVEGRINAASTMVRQDTNDFSRYYQPIMDPALVDNHAVLALHQSVLAALRSGTGAWFSEVLRRPDEIGDLSDRGRRKMPALMRGADGRYLTLSSRQIDTIVQVAVGNMFAKPRGGEEA